MNAIVRLWLAFAALGAGLIHVAVGASAPFPLSVILVGFGLAELGWGVATLVRGRLLAPRTMMGIALIPVFVWGTTATLGSGLGVSAEATGLPVFPMMIASLFNLVLAAGLALHERRAARGGAAEPAASGSQGWRFVTALTLGAVIFSGLTTPALAATKAGDLAVPHGTLHGTSQHDH